MPTRNYVFRLTITSLAVLGFLVAGLMGLAAVPDSSEPENANAPKPESFKSDSLALGQIPYLSWIDPNVKPRVALLCIHGLGLNSGAFADFGTSMSHRGIATYAIDVRGFGEWLKLNGKSKIDFNATLDDIKITLQKIRSENPGMPVFLLGESMGGAIALRACSMYPELVDGLISSAPSGDRFDSSSSSLTVALHSLHGLRKQYDVGTQIIKSGTESEGSKTQNTKLREIWESDPLNRMDLSPLQLIQFQRFMNGNYEAAERITNTPVLMVQGTLDHLVKPQGTWGIFNQLKTQAKTFLAFPSEHLIFEYGRAKPDTKTAQIAAVLAMWIYIHCHNSPGIPPIAIQLNNTIPAEGQLSAAVPKDFEAR